MRIGCPLYLSIAMAFLSASCSGDSDSSKGKKQVFFVKMLSTEAKKAWKGIWTWRLELIWMHSTETCWVVNPFPKPLRMSYLCLPSQCSIGGTLNLHWGFDQRLQQIHVLYQQCAKDSIKEQELSICRLIQTIQTQISSKTRRLGLLKMIPFAFGFLCILPYFWWFVSQSSFDSRQGYASTAGPPQEGNLLTSSASKAWERELWIVTDHDF